MTNFDLTVAELVQAGILKKKSIKNRELTYESAFSKELLFESIEETWKDFLNLYFIAGEP